MMNIPGTSRSISMVALGALTTNVLSQTGIIEKEEERYPGLRREDPQWEYDAEFQIWVI